MNLGRFHGFLVDQRRWSLDWLTELTGCTPSHSMYIMGPEFIPTPRTRVGPPVRLPGNLLEIWEQAAPFRSIVATRKDRSPRACATTRLSDVLTGRPRPHRPREVDDIADGGEGGCRAAPCG